MFEQEISASEMSLGQAHAQLAKFNRQRFRPTVPEKNWRFNVMENARMLLFEGELLERERDKIQQAASNVPSDPLRFVNWFENLKDRVPGQESSLLQWLAKDADYSQMSWYVLQDLAGQADTSELLTYTQVGLSARARLEMARTFWDEMSHGLETGPRFLLRERTAHEFEISMDPLAILPEALARFNLMVGLAATRRYAYHSIGALALVQLTDPERFRRVHQGLVRLGINYEGRRYYMRDVAHETARSEGWHSEILFPLVRENSAWARPLAEGALMESAARERCIHKMTDYLVAKH